MCSQQYQQRLQHSALIPKLVLACVDDITKLAQAENGLISLISQPNKLAPDELPVTWVDCHLSPS